MKKLRENYIYVVNSMLVPLYAIFQASARKHIRTKNINGVKIILIENMIMCNKLN